MWRQVTVYGDPVPQGSMHAFNNRVVHHNDRKLKDWRKKVRAHFTTYEMWKGPITVELEFWLYRGKTVKRDLPSVKPDIDKLARAILDALTGVVYADDSQVCQLVVVKRYGPKPGVQITVRGCDDDRHG